MMNTKKEMDAFYQTSKTEAYIYVIYIENFDDIGSRVLKTLFYV